MSNRRATCFYQGRIDKLDDGLVPCGLFHLLAWEADEQESCVSLYT